MARTFHAHNRIDRAIKRSLNLRRERRQDVRYEITRQLQEVTLG